MVEKPDEKRLNSDHGFKRIEEIHSRPGHKGEFMAYVRKTEEARRDGFDPKMIDVPESIRKNAGAPLICPQNRCRGDGHEPVFDQSRRLLGYRVCSCKKMDTNNYFWNVFRGGLGKRYQDFNPHDYIRRGGSWGKCLEIGYSMMEKKPVEGVMIRGTTGSGKTTLGIILTMKAILQFGTKAEFTTGSEFMVKSKERRRNEDFVPECEIYLQRIADAPILFFDDFCGSDRAEDQEAFSRIIERRYANCLLTYITAGLSVDQMARRAESKTLAKITLPDRKWMRDVLIRSDSGSRSF